ncbi:hypothetical protein Sango_1753400 [Sesamum angolense]|uniref:Uncharacterized protein n=1 Tax=Sesamum angolense TaxID=2727404 RepID=A0AAE2BP99_9LAMI|nr:hypothetical protein Sango_1753400 [Sesamum angolense]
MGASQSAQVPSEDEHQEPEEEDDDDDDDDIDEDEDDDDPQHDTPNNTRDHALVKKILEQEPEMLPCHASASPFPQLSTYGTPRMGPSIKARALAVFLKSQGVRFNAIYTSPLDRVRATALSVCQELNFSEEHIQSSDALLEMSNGHWEGCHRQVEFRMVQFLNGTIVAFPDKFRSDFSPPDPSDNPGFANRSSHALANLIPDREGPSLAPPHWDLLHRHRQGLPRKKSGKSRLQIVTTTGDHEADDEMSPREPNNPGLVRDINVRSNPPALVSSCVGVFSHSTPIKCLLTGLLGCSPVMSQDLHRRFFYHRASTFTESWLANKEIERHFTS